MIRSLDRMLDDLRNFCRAKDKFNNAISDIINLKRTLHEDAAKLLEKEYKAELEAIEGVQGVEFTVKESPENPALFNIQCHIDSDASCICTKIEEIEEEYNMSILCNQERGRSAQP